MKIMFVCTGNICRSAMAHWLLKKKLEEKKIQNVEVYSSGIYAEDNDISTYEAIEVMKEYDIDLKKHRATSILNSNIRNMDIILGMTENHKNELIYMYPDLKNRIFTLKEFVNYNREGHSNINIKDPWGFDIETYRSCLSEIDECLELLINKIENIK